MRVECFLSGRWRRLWATPSIERVVIIFTVTGEDVFNAKTHRTVDCAKARKAVTSIKRRRRLDSREKAYRRSRKRGIVVWRRRWERTTFRFTLGGRWRSKSAARRLLVLRDTRRGVPLAVRLVRLVRTITVG